jgi:hypothetical protein
MPKMVLGRRMVWTSLAMKSQSVYPLDATADEHRQMGKFGPPTNMSL